jgi:hypothetical protein
MPHACPRRLLTVGSCLATRLRIVGRHGSSRGRPTARRPAQSTPGGARRRTPKDRARIRSDRPVLDRPAWEAPKGCARRLVRRRLPCHRYGADTAALIRPAVGIETITRQRCLAASDEINGLRERERPIARPLLCERVQVKRAEPNHTRGKRDRSQLRSTDRASALQQLNLRGARTHADATALAAEMACGHHTATS